MVVLGVMMVAVGAKLSTLIWVVWLVVPPSFPFPLSLVN
jgi:hypothetical protein